MSDPERWIRRFTATDIGFPAWSASTPQRVALVSNRSGTLQVWSYDLDRTAWRQISDEPVGVEQVLVAPDGRLVWWRDPSGDERGHWVAVPPDGAEAQPLVLGLHDAWSAGISFAGDRVAVGSALPEGYRVVVRDAEGPLREIYRHEQPAGVGAEWPEGGGGLSADGSLLCIRHCEHGDILHPSLRVLDAATGAVVGDLTDEGRRLEPRAWSPIPGDQRLAFTSELGPFERPAVWDLTTKERRDVEVDVPGAVVPVCWFPDGSGLLVTQQHEGLERLHRVEPATGATRLIADPAGEVPDAAVRPDGQVWLRTSSSAAPPRIVDAAGTEVLPSPDPSPPQGRPYRSMWFSNPDGDRIQSFVATPPGDGPFPTVMSVHGGPEWHDREMFDPETQAYVDAGFAVALVNYRGSTGYGVAFRERLVGHACELESADILACLDRLIEERVADPDRVFFAGWSWGGCLACYNAGAHPERWRAIFAGIPAGDFVAAHDASAPSLQAWDVGTFGGTPEQVPDAYRRADPMTYVEGVRAPVLVIAGEHDSRCPIEGVTPWVDAVRKRGVRVEVVLYPEGHHANAMAAKVDHMRSILGFFRQYV